MTYPAILKIPKRVIAVTRLYTGGGYPELPNNGEITLLEHEQFYDVIKSSSNWFTILNELGQEQTFSYGHEKPVKDSNYDHSGNRWYGDIVAITRWDSAELETIQSPPAYAVLDMNTFDPDDGIDLIVSDNKNKSEVDFRYKRDLYGKDIMFRNNTASVYLVQVLKKITKTERPEGMVIIEEDFNAKGNV